MAEDQNLEGVDTGEAVEGADLSWVPEKFRSNPEKLAEAYTNLEREYHKSRQEVTGLQESISSLSEQFEEFTAAQNQPDPMQVQSHWEERYANDPIATTIELWQALEAQKPQPQQAQPAADPNMIAFAADYSMTQQHEDWSDYKGRVSELIAGNPLFQDDRLWSDPQTAATTMNSAYEMVKAQDVLSGNSVVQQQAADTRAMKLAAQSAAGSSGRTPSPDEATQRWEEIMNAPSTKLGL